MSALRLAFRALIGVCAFQLALVCAAAALLAQAGATNVKLDVLAQFAPFWLAGGVVALPLAFVFRGVHRTLIMTPAVLAIVAAAALMLPEAVRSTGPKAPANAAGRLKIVQFNVWRDNPDPAAIVDWLIREQPDIVIMEEAHPAIRKLLTQRSGWFQSCAACDVTIFSKEQPLPAATHRFDGPWVGPLAEASFRDARGTYTVVGVHYAWPTDAGDQQRQEARLAELLALLPKDRVIAAGDLNSTPWSYQRRRWDRAFGLIRRERAVFSWPARRSEKFIPAPFPFLPIDHLYAGRGWATVSVSRGPRLSSDHYPLVAVLAPAAPP